MNIRNTALQMLFVVMMLGEFSGETLFAQKADDVSSSSTCDEVNILDGRVFIFEYENGYSFQLSYSKFNLNWRALKGPEEGRSEQDSYRWSEVAPNTYMVSWTEREGTFVNTVVNLETLKVHSSGMSEGKTWFWRGKVTVIK